MIKKVFISVCLSLLIFSFRVSAISPPPPPELAILLLQEPYFQDNLRDGKWVDLDNNVAEIEDKINSLLKKMIKMNLTKPAMKLAEKFEELKEAVETKKKKDIEGKFNNLNDDFYEIYSYFKLKDSPEVNFFFIDIGQLENYLKKNDFNNMITEVYEMQNFSMIIIERFKSKNIFSPKIKFLFKYFNIILSKLEWAILDKDSKTVKELVPGLKELVSEFQQIYSKGK